jgi:hypothetical protein
MYAQCNDANIRNCPRCTTQHTIKQLARNHPCVTAWPSIYMGIAKTTYRPTRLFQGASACGVNMQRPEGRWLGILIFNKYHWPP